MQTEECLILESTDTPSNEYQDILNLFEFLPDNYLLILDPKGILFVKTDSATSNIADTNLYPSFNRRPQYILQGIIISSLARNQETVFQMLDMRSIGPNQRVYTTLALSKDLGSDFLFTYEARRIALVGVDGIEPSTTAL